MDHSDVFLSYRRKDVEFARRLDKAFKDTGREVWVDWEDIPPGVAGFTDEIERGIEGSDAFIALLSPDYVQSEYCLMELAQAIQLNKRIVPVVVRKFEDYPIPQGIGHINWVYFCPHAGHENTFEESFPKVVTALEADFDYIRSHTRLLLRGREWDAKHRENSFLLTRKEIDDAEHWLAKGATIQPQPTPLHTDYIFASRAWERVLQRRTRIVLSIGLVLTLGLLAAAIWLGIMAEANRKEAVANAIRADNSAATVVHQSGISQSISFSVMANGELNKAPEASVQLGIEALENYPYTTQAEHALSNAVQDSRLRYVYDGSAAGWS
ncbi:MAG TPA: toll/interleukin-1 receptor domain-containing protein, partial [Phototrophicaceae bacterium]|nr:toll/interleukin-1 receptor domain-containing protein [Phototrophicaceae bacterium]